jgi:NAD(P)-dependent dehydrogenase (short-subunit alcohol dehydrogenase family)
MVKTWFITGTSSGLGRLLAERLLQRGDRVVATLRRRAPSGGRLRPTALQLGAMPARRSPQ